MLPINQLLARFKNLTNTEKVKKQLILEILTENKIPLQINQITISKTSVFLKTQPIIKTEILLKKEKIIKQIQSISGLGNISDIQ